MPGRCASPATPFTATRSPSTTATARPSMSSRVASPAAPRARAGSTRTAPPARPTPSPTTNFSATASYTNRSNSFSPNAQRASAGLNSSETARGWDYGFKCGFLEDRLQFTLGGYYIDRTGVSTTEILANGTTVSTSAGNQNAKGV